VNCRQFRKIMVVPCFILQRVDLLLGNDRETNNETTSVARQHILNKQMYAAVTE
jgi:hypothetical protein